MFRCTVLSSAEQQYVGYKRRCGSAVGPEVKLRRRLVVLVVVARFKGDISYSNEPTLIIKPSNIWQQ